MNASKISVSGSFTFRATAAIKFIHFALMLLNPWCPGVEMEITQKEKPLREMTEEDFNEAHGG